MPGAERSGRPGPRSLEPPGAGTRCRSEGRARRPRGGRAEGAERRRRGAARGGGGRRPAPSFERAAPSPHGRRRPEAGPCLAVTRATAPAERSPPSRGGCATRRPPPPAVRAAPSAPLCSDPSRRSRLDVTCPAAGILHSHGARGREADGALPVAALRPSRPQNRRTRGALPRGAGGAREALCPVRVYRVAYRTALLGFGNYSTGFALPARGWMCLMR